MSNQLVAPAQNAKKFVIRAILTLGVLAAAQGCSDGSSKSSPCDAICDCVGNAGGPEAKNSCRTECSALLAQGGDSKACGATLENHGFSQCEYTCGAFDAQNAATAGSDGGLEVSASEGERCTSEGQTGTRTECDWSYGISDPDIACDDVPVYGTIEGIQCSGSCVDTDSDDDHCGGCDIRCDSDETCDEGQCWRDDDDDDYGEDAGVDDDFDDADAGLPDDDRLPDLEITDFNATATVQYTSIGAGTGTANLTVCLADEDGLVAANFGDANSPTFNVIIALGSEPAIGVAKLQGQALQVDYALTWNDGCGSVLLNVPGDVAFGTYYVGAMADAEEVVSELDEDNNTLVATDPTTGDYLEVTIEELTGVGLR